MGAFGSVEYVTITKSPSVKGLRVPKWFADDPSVNRWLVKYGSVATQRGFAYYLLRYLQWLKEAKKVSLSPGELLKENLGNVYGSGPLEVERKRLHTDWLQEYVSLKGPLKGLSNSYRRTSAAAIRSFYARNDSPLFGDFQVPFNAQEEKLTKQISIDDARRCISVLPLRSRSLCVCLLQCGMRVTEFLQLKWKTLQPGMEKEEWPVKVPLRNDVGKEYFTFLGRESLEALKFYLNYRQSLVRQPIKPEEYIFIDDFMAAAYETNRPLLSDYLTRQIVRALVSKGMVKKNGEEKWRCDFHPHALRHLFKTECAHAGIHPMISEFWMGHDKGIEYVYNHQHELHPKDFVEMYRKVEPYLSLNPQATETHEEITTLRERMAKMEQTLTVLQNSIAQGKKQIDSIR